ncbi:MAG TPA: DNA repair protein RadA, partial [Clostridiales bacterium]|nr:DNA repair protein RadA [Clostridiales bacterium]
GKQKTQIYQLDSIISDTEVRYHTGLKELDLVLGGGIVKGSLVLVSGDPGIGKSTLLLQICEKLSAGKKILYVSGEESIQQLKLRADRLGVKTGNLFFMCETDCGEICSRIASDAFGLVIIDSIQTMLVGELASSPGSVTQVREATAMLMRTAKSGDIPMFIVGHVNKDGNIAGPKVLEHIVDTVLYFEGDRNHTYRILRAVKNRYGSTNEIGVFEMTDAGLLEVENPSLTLIAGRPQNTSGICVGCVMEGTRPILAEVQSLVAPTSFGNPRRIADGFDYNRMSMLIAVLEKRAGYYFGNCDAYVNIAGGLRIEEPASDLAVAIALVSGLKDVATRYDALAFGEIGLAGEIRAVSNCEKRIAEAVKLGFQTCVIPAHNYKKLPSKLKSQIEIYPARHIRDAFDAISVK